MPASISCVGWMGSFLTDCVWLDARVRAYSLNIWHQSKGKVAIWLTPVGGSCFSSMYGINFISKPHKILCEISPSMFLSKYNFIQ